MRAVDREIRIWTAALILLTTGSLAVEFRQIDRSLPYPLSVEEGQLAEPATRTVTTGTLHPETFNQPSLPKYLAAAGISFGFLRAASRLQIQDVHAIGRLTFPYYETPAAMKTARQVFALTSIVAIAATA